MAQNSYATVGALNTAYKDIYERIQGLGGMWDLKGDCSWATLYATTAATNGDVWNINSIDGMPSDIKDVKVGSNLACKKTYSGVTMNNTPTSANYWRNYWMVVSGMLDFASETRAGMIKLGVTDETVQSSTTATSIVRKVYLTNEAKQAHVTVPIASATSAGIITCDTSTSTFQTLQGNKEVNGDLRVTGTLTATIEGAAAEVKIYPTTTSYTEYPIAVRQGAGTTDSQGRLTHKLYNCADFKYKNDGTGFTISGGGTNSKSAKIDANASFSGSDIVIANATTTSATVNVAGESTVNTSSIVSSTVNKASINADSTKTLTIVDGNASSTTRTPNLTVGGNVVLGDYDTSVTTGALRIRKVAATGNTDVNLYSSLNVGTATQTGAVTLRSTGTTGTTIIGPAGGTINLPANSSTNNMVLAQATAGTSSWLAYTSSNTASTLVSRDSSGNFSAGTITANLDGKATDAAHADTADTAGASTQIKVTAVDPGTNGHYLVASDSNTTGNIDAKVFSDVNITSNTTEFGIHKVNSTTQGDTYLNVRGGGTYIETNSNGLLSIIASNSTTSTTWTNLYVTNNDPSTAPKSIELESTTNSIKLAHRSQTYTSLYDSFEAKGQTTLDASTTGQISLADTTGDSVIIKGANTLTAATVTNSAVSSSKSLSISAPSSTTAANLVLYNSTTIDGGAGGLTINNSNTSTAAKINVNNNVTLSSAASTTLSIESTANSYVRLTGNIQASVSNSDLYINGWNTTSSTSINPRLRINGAVEVDGSYSESSDNRTTFYTISSTTPTTTKRTLVAYNNVQLQGSTSSTTGSLSIGNSSTATVNIVTYGNGVTLRAPFTTGSTTQTGSVSIMSNGTSATTIIGPNNGNILLPTNPTSHDGSTWLWSSSQDTSYNVTSSMRKLVTAWSTTPLDTYIPSEKLVKDTLDTCEKTANKVIAWSTTPSDTNYPSEKLVKNAIDNAGATTTTVTIATSAWSGGSATVTVTGMTSSKNVIVVPGSSYASVINSYGVYCSAQGTNTLTFKCADTPTVAIAFNVWYK